MMFMIEAKDKYGKEHFIVGRKYYKSGDWECFEYDDGWLECHRHFDFQITDSLYSKISKIGSLYELIFEGPFPFPKTFIEAPNVIIQLSGTDSYNGCFVRYITNSLSQIWGIYFDRPIEFTKNEWVRFDVNVKGKIQQS